MTERCSLALVLLAMSAGMAGCHEAGGAPAVAAVRDSAGVRLVDNRGHVWTEGTAWRVGEALVEIGGFEVSPEYQLYDVRGASVLPDGRIVVANNGSHELRYYGPAGHFLKAVGQEGGGPGEFKTIWSLTRVEGDSLLIWDSGNMRMSVHSADGEFVRTFRLANGTDGIARFPGPELIVFRDGTFLGLEWLGTAMSEAPPGVFRDTADYYLFDATGHELAAVGRFPWTEMFLGSGEVQMQNGNTMREMSTLRFGRQLHLAAGDSTFWMESGDGTLSRFDAKGRLLRRTRRIDRRRIAVTPDLAAREIEAFMAVEEGHGHPQTQLDAQRKQRQRVPTADTVPVYRRLLVDAQGTLWGELDPGVPDPTRPSSWDVFESSGRYLGSVSLPPRFEPFEIGSDYVLGVRKDELDIEHLLQLPLVKGGNRSAPPRVDSVPIRSAASP